MKRLKVLNELISITNLIKPINADGKTDLDRLKEKFCAFDIVFQATIKRIKPDKGRKANKNNVRMDPTYKFAKRQEKSKTKETKNLVFKKVFGPHFDPKIRPKQKHSKWPKHNIKSKKSQS